jgi:hypothetical protein
MCTDRGGRRAFFCPEATRFNQRTLVCDHEKKVHCAEAAEFFHRNVVLHQEALRATDRQHRKKGEKRNDCKQCHGPSVKTPEIQQDIMAKSEFPLTAGFCHFYFDDMTSRLELITFETDNQFDQAFLI